MLDKDFHYEKIEAVAFDLFNTLVYINNPVNPYLWLFDLLSLSIQEKGYFKNLFLTKNTNKITSVFPEEYHAVLASLNSEFIQKINVEVDSVMLYSDTLSTLSTLSSNIPLYLVSNLATPYKKAVYNLGIDKYFTSILFSCDKKAAKPDQKIFSQLKEATALSGNKILMVGDSYSSDFLGSQNAGLKSILIKRKYSKLSTHTKSIRSLAPLVKLFA